LLCLCGPATAAAAPLHGRPAKTSSCEAAAPIPREARASPSRNQSLVPPSAAPAGYGLLVAAGELERPQRVQLVVVLIDVLAGTNA